MKENPDKKYGEVARKFGVDRKALRERSKGARTIETHPGRKSFLTKEEEDCLVTHLIDMAEIGFGYDAVQIRILVRTLLGKDESQVTESWYRGFMERHSNLSRRRAQCLEKQRLLSSDEKSIQSYFQILQVAFQKCQDFSGGEALTSNRIFGADECGFNNDNANLYVVTKKGAKNAFSLDPGISTHITIMSFASANGWAGPPFFIIPGVRQKTNFNNQVKAFFPEGKVSLTKKGFMTEESFSIWVEFFIENIKCIRGDPKNWVLLILDGHHSHTYCLNALKTLNTNNILVIGLPSHATHILQVHDVSVFRSLKEGFRKQCNEWLKNHRLKVNRVDYPEILYKPWSDANSSSNIRNGFRSTGVWPLNINWARENKDKIKLLTSTVTEKFDKICAQHLANSPEGAVGLLKSCEYINIDLPSKCSLIKGQEKTFCQSLYSISMSAEKHLSNAKKVKGVVKRKEPLGENRAHSRILNDDDRLNKLDNLKTKRESKIPIKLEKKLITFSQQLEESKVSTEPQANKRKEDPLLNEERKETAPDLKKLKRM